MNMDKTVQQKVIAKLYVEKGEYDSDVILLDENPKIIGRDKSVNVRFNHSSVSRQHAEIIFKENRFIIKDLDSTNGTLLNKERVDKNGSELVHGDKIVLGIYEKFIVLRFSISGATTRIA